MPANETFRGSLLTRHFVRHVLAEEFAGRLGEASVAAGRRRCVRWRREAHGRLGPASSVRAIWEVGAAPLFAQVGYAGRMVRVGSQGGLAEEEQASEWGERLVGVLEGTRGVRLAVVVSPWQERLDRVWRVAVRVGMEARQRWCVCFNGHQLRVVDVDRPYARRFLEFDLRQAFEDERGFPLLWALLRPEALARPARGSAPPLLDQIVAACDAHGGSVREALQHGVRHALASLATALARADGRHVAKSYASAAAASTAAAATSTSTSTAAAAASAAAAAAAAAAAVAPAAGAVASEVVAQALTMIYRLLFLLFAEARVLVPVWHPVYRDSYSIGGLHALVERGEGRGLWEAVQAVSRLAHEGCVTDDLSVTAFNGQLFSPDHTPLGEQLQIPSSVIAGVLDALMMTPPRARRGRERITYADLGVEQLGTVYERVLDYAPLLERDIGAMVSRPTRGSKRLEPEAPATAAAAAPAAVAAVAAAAAAATTFARQRTSTRPARGRSSVQRKESGSFYTPRGMADYLVRTTLGPVVAEASAEDILGVRVLDPAMGSGAFLVSACRFLAAAYDQACERDGRPPVSAAARAAAQAEVRRHIARQCLFGVDLNPMAVQLARLSVWLTTMRRDAPLTFLDHHLRVGDSLVGASLDDLVRRRPGRSTRSTRSRATATGAVDLPLFAGDEHAQVMRAILPARAALTAIDDSASTVREKERLLRALTREGALARWLQLADAWCASWFAADGTAAPAEAFPAIADYLLHSHAAFAPKTIEVWLAAIRGTAERRRFFHWTLEFPEVFFDDSGQPRANGGFDAIVGNPPWDMIRNDACSDDGDGGGDAPTNGLTDVRDAGALSRFVREAGLYRSAGDAHVNCYQLFVERTLALLKRGGRFGLVLPWGIAADHGGARLRRRLLESCDLDTLVSFENNRAIFPIHRSTRFALLTGTTGRPTNAVRCRLGERDPTVLDTFSAERWHDRLDGHRPAPDGDVSKRAAETEPARPPIAMTVDLLRHVSGEGLAFPDARTLMDVALLDRLHTAHPPLASPDGWHVKFGRELNVSVDRALFEPIGRPQRPEPAQRPVSRIPVIDGKHLRPFAVSLANVTHAVRPEQIAALRARLPDIARPRLAFRDIASPTNRLTLIAAILPADTVSTHTISCLKSSLALDAQWCLCALLNSLVANVLVRLRVSTHVTVALMERLPVPRPLADSTLFRELVDLALTLSRSPSLDGARSDNGTRGPTYARLQACAAHAYGLSDAELRYVLTKFPLIEEDTKQATLEHFTSVPP